MFLESNEGAVPQNEFGSLNFFLTQITNFLVRAEKVSTTPPLECTFSPFGQPGAPKRGKYHEKVFGPKISRNPLVFDKKAEKRLD